MIYNEQIRESWWKYLKDEFEFSTESPPYLFRDPHCATCCHWFLINEEGLHHLSITSSPTEYDEIINDLKGKRHYTVREEGEIIDSYMDYRFYGWCRRFPPAQRNNYSIFSFRTLFTFLKRNIPQKVAEYDFPLMPHISSCGEWKESNWVPEFIKEQKGKAQQ